MVDEFLLDLKYIYEKVVGGELENISEFKTKWEIEKSIGEVYQNLCKKELKVDMGSFYTPYDIVKFMVRQLLENVDYKENPNMKILDPSCGGGYFLIEVYNSLKEIGEKEGITNIAEHILNNNIYGCDTDENAVMISVLELFNITGCITNNVVKEDFLTHYSGEFDLIIGNPPYMGHKVLVGEYREILYEQFSSVFYDKGDISYCFIKKAIDLLKDGGKLEFFTSRYILEASNGEGIRNFILKNGFLSSVIDFYGVRVVKGVGVDNIIFNYIKGANEDITEFYRLDKKAKYMESKVFEDIIKQDFIYSRNIKIEYSKLDKKGFIFLTSEEQAILNKIIGVALNSICDSFQGVITGCDKAFVVNSSEIAKLNLDKNLLLPWIKGKNINRFEVTESEEVIIYPGLIVNEETSSNSIKHISKYYEKLNSRRECKKGMRKWYEHQWGRNIQLFQDKKIVFPYKSNRNRFAIDSGNCFSADVYSIKIKEKYEENFTYEFLVGILNSSLYEFYIKAVAKKLGEDLYEYYPNKIMTLIVPEYIEAIDREVRHGGEGLRERVDTILNKYLGIDKEEYKIIRNMCN